MRLKRKPKKIIEEKVKEETKEEMREAVSASPTTIDEPNFSTTDAKLVERLQSSFDVSEVKVDSATGERLFIFNEKKSVIEQFLGGN